MDTNIAFYLSPGPLQIGLIEADGVCVLPSRAAYVQKISEEIAHILQPGWVYPDSLQKGIRSLLKAYGFHPSGRNRPASEFLVKDLQGRGSFNSINNVVDINNHVSLISHLPISIFDRQKTGNQLMIRVGMEGEQYIFNREGHELSLRDLLIVARGDGDKAALGSPVKDSQATKVFEGTSSLVGIIYSSTTLLVPNALAGILGRFADLLKTEAMAKHVEWSIIDAPQH
ncbi:MAG: phenylalanine--tRNA ligase beta subunit-related protein [Candidatus Ozemobacteraceae bacterium]